MVRLTDLPDMTLDAYRGCKTKIQQQQQYDFKTLKAFYVACLNEIEIGLKKWDDDF